LADLHKREHKTTGPVFATKDGGEPDAANVRREFRAAVKSAGIHGAWSLRELQHTFVSLMSDSGVPVEEIARLAGTPAPARPRSSTGTSCAPSWRRAPRRWISCSSTPCGPELLAGGDLLAVLVSGDGDGAGLGLLVHRD
jgi:hypothetical protein